jgi:hypothetical protein
LFHDIISVMRGGEFTPRYDQDEQNVRAGYLASMHFPPDTPGLELVSTQELAEMAYEMRMPDSGASFLRKPDNPLDYPIVEEYSENAEYDVR